MIRLHFRFPPLFFAAALPIQGQIDRITGKPFATRSEVIARHGMVCTSVPLATQVGLDIPENVAAPL
jgi:gamma-glutamyltranspeptidase/glutathione hydrolase